MRTRSKAHWSADAVKVARPLRRAIPETHKPKGWPDGWARYLHLYPHVYRLGARHVRAGRVLPPDRRLAGLDLAARRPGVGRPEMGIRSRTGQGGDLSNLVHHSG